METGVGVGDSLPMSRSMSRAVSIWGMDNLKSIRDTKYRYHIFLITNLLESILLLYKKNCMLLCY